MTITIIITAVTIAALVTVIAAAARFPRVNSALAWVIFHMLMAVWPAEHPRRREHDAVFTTTPPAERMRFARDLLGREMLDAAWQRLRDTSATTRIALTTITLTTAAILRRPDFTVPIILVFGGTGVFAVVILRNWSKWEWSARWKVAGCVPATIWMAGSIALSVVNPPAGDSFSQQQAGSTATMSTSFAGLLLMAVVGIVALGFIASGPADYLEQRADFLQKRSASRPARRPTYSPSLGGWTVFAACCTALVIGVPIMQAKWVATDPGPGASVTQIQAYQTTVMEQVFVLVGGMLVLLLTGPITGGVLWLIRHRAERDYQRDLITADA